MLLKLTCLYKKQKEPSILNLSALSPFFLLTLYLPWDSDFTSFDISTTGGGEVGVWNGQNAAKPALIDAGSPSDS